MARVFIHPDLQRRYSPGEIALVWMLKGYLLSNTKHGRVEAHRERRSVVDISSRK